MVGHGWPSGAGKKEGISPYSSNEIMRLMCRTWQEMAKPMAKRSKWQKLARMAGSRGCRKPFRDQNLRPVVRPRCAPWQGRCAHRGGSCSQRRGKSIHRSSKSVLPQGPRRVFSGKNRPITFFQKVLATTIYGVRLRQDSLLNGACGRRCKSTAASKWGMT